MIIIASVAGLIFLVLIVAIVVRIRKNSQAGAGGVGPQAGAGDDTGGSGWCSRGSRKVPEEDKDDVVL
jgi:hypothetical protein